MAISIKEVSSRAELSVYIHLPDKSLLHMDFDVASVSLRRNQLGSKTFRVHSVVGPGAQVVPAFGVSQRAELGRADGSRPCSASQHPEVEGRSFFLRESDELYGRIRRCS